MKALATLRPLLVALLVVPGVLIGIWLGTGHGQGTAPPRPATPADAVQQAQAPQAVPITRPEQRKTPHDQQSREDRALRRVGDAAGPGAGARLRLGAGAFGLVVGDGHGRLLVPSAVR